MRILFIGGTGLISSACSAATVAAGHELWLLNRGRSKLPTVVAQERLLTADAADEAQVRAAVAGLDFDVVVQWVGFQTDQVEKDVRVFAGAGQYVFISSASVYEKPPSHWMIAESTPTVNPYWQYSRDKIACEETLRRAYRERGFPATIVRPSLTYGPSQIPVVIGSWQKPFTIVDRMRRGARIIVPGDGTSIWTLTHNSDFAKGLLGLFGHPGAIGQDFHITSEESLTWNQIYELVGRAAGAEPMILHVPSDAIVASDPEQEGNLWGDKSYSTVFDNDKLRSLVPGFKATVPFSAGIQETIAWFDADPRRQEIDHAANERWDRLVRVYDEALRRAAESTRSAT
ncbi:MAG: NAD-dependent epimerase/dehydratase family protein [Acidimicrobiales bacterium]|jgi:nucleoside-diphosphate-sugar epimerase